MARRVEENLDKVWRALSSRARRDVLDLLRDGPKATGEVSLAFPEISRFAVMQHLSVLEEAGLVITRQQGRSTLNYLNAVPLRQIYERWVSRFADTCAGELIDLRRASEAPLPPVSPIPGDRIKVRSGHRSGRTNKETRRD